MTALLRIFFLIPLGYVAACLAAGFFFVIAAIGLGPEGTYLTTYRGETLLLAAAVSVWAGALASVPALIAIVIGEALGWRSIFFYLLVGGATGIGVALMGDAPEMAFWSADARLFLATGCGGGGVYWLIAGRNAGFAIARRGALS